VIRRLTEAVVSSLQTSKVQEDVFNTSTPGAGLRLHKGGRKVFFILYYVHGKRRRHYFGEHTTSKRGRVEYAPELGISVREFERLYAMFKGDLVRGIDPQGVTVAVSPEAAKRIPCESLPEALRRTFPGGVLEGTVGYLLKEFLEKYAASQLTPRGYLNYRQVTRAYLAPAFDIPVSEFGEMEARRLFSAISRRAPQAVRQVKSALSGAFNYGREHIHGVSSNPCLGIKVTVKKGKRDRWLTDSEIATLLAALPTMKDERAADVYRLILASLCRSGEAASIRAEDIITLDGVRVWKVADPKNGQEFLIPLVGPIAEIINRRFLAVGGKGFLFWNISPGDDYPCQLKRANRELRELTRLADIRPHDLRRTGRTHVSGLGIRDEVAEALLNHAKETVNGTYNLYTYWPERQEALRLWHNKLAQIAAGENIKAA
jgi:integrase